MKTLLFAIIVFGSLISAAQETICHRFNKINPAQEPSLMPRCRVVGETFYFDGAVTDEIYYEIKVHYPQVKRLELNSYGGLIEAGFKIAELVRERQIHTNVRKGAKCASACTLIFQAGAIRTAYPSVRFLYHGARLGGNWLDGWWELRDMKGREAANEFIAEQMIEVRRDTEKLFEAYRRYGMAEEFIQAYKKRSEVSTWFEDGNFYRVEDWIVSVPALMNVGVVQEFDYREQVEE